MSRVARLRASWPTSLLVHGYKTALAAVIALPIVTDVSGPVLSVREPVAEWVAAMQTAASLASHGGRALALPLLAAALITPWLTVAWLSALARDGSVAGHLRWALPRYRAACAVALLGIGYLVLLSLSAGGIALLVTRASASWHDARASDLLLAVALGPVALAALYGLTFQDVAQAGLALDANPPGPVRPRFPRVAAALRHALARTTAKLVLVRGALLLFQCTLGVLAWSVPRLGLGSSLASDAGVMIATQSAALTFTLTRAAWLATLARDRARIAELPDAR